MLSALLRITYILLLVLGIAGLFWFAPPDTPTFAAVIMAAVLYGPASDRHSRFSHWHAGCSKKLQCTICESLPTGRAESVQL